MSLRQSLQNIFEECLPEQRPDGSAGSRRLNQNRRHVADLATGVPVETLLTELKRMPNGARAELITELFVSVKSKIEQTQLLVKLADAVNA